MNGIFEKGTRLNVQFKTCRGIVGITDLWQAPLISDDGFNLDEFAKTINRKLKEEVEESFVAKKTSKSSLLTLQLDIVKRIIDVKLLEQEEAVSMVKKAKRREMLKEQLEKIENEEIAGMSADDIKKELGC